MSEEEKQDNNQIDVKDKEIAELKSQIEELKKENSYDDIKEKYEKALEVKDNEINELKKENKELGTKTDEALDKLSREVQTRLEENEKFKKMQEMVAELENERADATIDNLIKRGIILGKQRDSAKELFLQNPDLFEKLYADAAPVVDTESKPKTKRINNIVKGLEYLTGE